MVLFFFVFKICLNAKNVKIDNVETESQIIATPAIDQYPVPVFNLFSISKDCLKQL